MSSIVTHTLMILAQGATTSPAGGAAPGQPTVTPALRHSVATARAGGWDPGRTAENALEVAQDSDAVGYIGDFEVVDNPTAPGQKLQINLKYSPERQRVISGIKRVSKPGLRVYAKSTELPRVLGGLGVAIISTSQGLLTDRQARKRSVGGEVLAFVW